MPAGTGTYRAKPGSPGELQGGVTGYAKKRATVSCHSFSEKSDRVKIKMVGGAPTDTADRAAGFKGLQQEDGVQKELLSGPVTLYQEGELSGPLFSQLPLISGGSCPFFKFDQGYGQTPAPLPYGQGRPESVVLCGERELRCSHRNSSIKNTTAQQATDTWNRLAPHQARATPAARARAPARGD